MLFFLDLSWKTQMYYCTVMSHYYKILGGKFGLPEFTASKMILQQNGKIRFWVHSFIWLNLPFMQFP